MVTDTPCGGVVENHTAGRGDQGLSPPAAVLKLGQFHSPHFAVIGPFNLVSVPGEVKHPTQGVNVLSSIKLLPPNLAVIGSIGSTTSSKQTGKCTCCTQMKQGFTFEINRRAINRSTQLYQINLGERFVSCCFFVWWRHHFPFRFCLCRLKV